MASVPTAINSSSATTISPTFGWRLTELPSPEPGVGGSSMRGQDGSEASASAWSGRRARHGFAGRQRLRLGEATACRVELHPAVFGEVDLDPGMRRADRHALDKLRIVAFARQDPQPGASGCRAGGAGLPSSSRSTGGSPRGTGRSTRPSTGPRRRGRGRRRRTRSWPTIGRSRPSCSRRRTGWSGPPPRPGCPRGAAPRRRPAGWRPEVPRGTACGSRPGRRSRLHEDG